MIKALLPRTLLLRVFLLIVVLITLSIAASIVISRYLERESRAQRMAQMVVSVVNLTRAAVLSAAPEWRSALLAELAASEGLHLLMTDSNDVSKPITSPAPEITLMMQKVRQNLGENTRFASEHNGVEGLWVSFFIGDEEFWVALPKRNVEHVLPQVLLAWSSLVLGLATLGAYLIARQVARPLKRLSQAAHQLGQGTSTQLLPEQGAHEIVTVTRAFNKMNSDLEAHERERALVLAGISHDLRTPLTRVRLAAEMSADESLRAGIAADVEQMDAVIRQFLDYVRLDESEAVAELDLKVLVREMALRFEHQAESLTLELHDVPAVPVRPLLLRRALANLLDNAIKYGGGQIVIKLRSEEHHIALMVIDHGAGIPAAQREAAKRPLIRLEAARSNVTGSGLGLAIVERVARLHGGQFQLADHDQRGLIAMLLLPLG